MDVTANPDDVAIATLVILPAAAAVALLLAARRADRVAGPVSVAVTLVTVGLGVFVAYARPALSVPFLGLVDGGALGLAVDGLSAVLVVMVTVVALAVTLFAVLDLPGDDARARFFGYLLLFVAAMLATVTATTLPALLLGWEVMGAMSYALIGFRWDIAGKLQAGTTAFVTTRTGDLGLYVAAGAALAGAGSLDLSGLSALDSGWRHVAAAGILVAAFGKSAQLPFSAWLSAAMQGPSAVSALLHSATMVAAGGYLLLRAMPLLEATLWAPSAAAWVGVLTALTLGAVACAQQDLKQALAASTAAQLGFVVLAAGVGTSAGGTDHLVAHAAVKSALFVAVGGWLTALGTTRADGLRGAGRRHPVAGAAAALGCLVLAGVPPLSLWVTKDEVLAGADGTALKVAGLAAGALAAAYAGRMLATVLARPSPEDRLDAEQRGTRQVPAGVAGVAVGLAAASVGLGVVAVPSVAHAVKELLNATGEPAPAPAAMVISAALAVVVLALTVARYRTVMRLDSTALGRWAGLPVLLSTRPVVALARVAATVDGGIDRAVRGAGGRVRRLAAISGRVDDGGIDRAVLGTGAAARWLAAMANRADGGGIDAAVRALASALRRAGASARRPQTGLLHQYYALTAAGLGVLLTLLLLAR